MTDVHQRFRVAAEDRPTSTQEGRLVSSMHRAANHAQSRRALVLMLVASFAAIVTRPANATPPVPFYTSRVTEIDRQSPGAVLIQRLGGNGVRLVPAEFARSKRRDGH